MRFVLDFGNYFFKMEAYRQVFGNRFLILRNENLWSSGQLVMNKVFRHLELSDLQTEGFAKKAYVTSEKQSIITDGALASLAKYYETDLQLLNQSFDLKLTK